MIDITLGPHTMIWEQGSLDMSYYINALPIIR